MTVVLVGGPLDGLTCTISRADTQRGHFTVPGARGRYTLDPVTGDWFFEVEARTNRQEHAR